MASLMILIMGWMVCAAFGAEGPPVGVPGKLKKEIKGKVSVSRPAKKVAPETGHWNFSMVYNAADQIKYGGNVNLLSGSTRFAVIDQTTAQAGVGIGYTFLKNDSFGYGTDFVYELARGSKGIQGTAGNYQVQGHFDGDPQISLATLNATGNYSFGKNIFVFAGVNYPFAFASDDRAQFSGLIGYQGGIGYKINKEFIFEAGYRLTAVKGHLKSNGLDFDVTEGDFAGMLLQLRYNFH
jgi:hypothetical protein